jgi:hypothetical protein
VVDDRAQQPEFSLARVQVVNWVLAVAMPLAAGMTFSWSIAWAILVGALIANLSFILLKNDLTKVMKGPLQAVKLQFFIKYYLRLSALAIGLYFLVRHGHIHVFGLLVGLSTVVVGIVVAAVSQARNIYITGKEAV